jgi:hypothetical protein
VCRIKAFAIFFPIQGITWVFAFLTFDGSTASQYVFTLGTVFQVPIEPARPATAAAPANWVPPFSPDGLILYLGMGRACSCSPFIACSTRGSAQREFRFHPHVLARRLLLALVF